MVTRQAEGFAHLVLPTKADSLSCGVYLHAHSLAMGFMHLHIVLRRLTISGHGVHISFLSYNAPHGSRSLEAPSCAEARNYCGTKDHKQHSCQDGP